LDQRLLRFGPLLVRKENEKKLVAQIQHLETAGRHLKVEALLLSSLNIGKSPGERRNELLVRHSMRRPEALAKVVAQIVVLDGQRLGMAESIGSNVAGDRESDLNVVVQRYIVDCIAEVALKAWMNLVELAKAAGDLRAIGADQQPIHFEQAHLGGVHKQFDSLCFAQAARLGVLNRIDAKKVIVVGGKDKML
jgi:hypothetical protein